MRGETIKMKTRRLSICACGFPCLDESILLGKEYEVLSRDGHPRTCSLGFVCGGCGAGFPITAVSALEKSGDFYFLPYELFQEAS